MAIKIDSVQIKRYIALSLAVGVRLISCKRIFTVRKEYFSVSSFESKKLSELHNIQLRGT